MKARAKSSPPPRNSVAVYANFAPFGPGQVIRNPLVKSRMVLWCKAGRGRVTVNGVPHSIEPRRYLVLPWAHDVRYCASDDDPFLLGGVHIVPDHSPAHPVRFEVPHTPQHPLARAAFRKDAPLPPYATTGWLDPARPLVHLLEFAACLFRRSNPPEWLARQLGRQVLAELAAETAARSPRQPDLPPPLTQMLAFVDFHIHAPLSLRDLVAFSRLSPSTVGRLFRDHLGRTPVAHILAARMDRAQTLLRAPHLSIAQIAAQVGIPDPFYFSKCFKKHTRQSPRDFRKNSAWI